jgi:hypothetical protein
VTDRTDLETRLARDLPRYAERCPVDVDAMALAREIARSSAADRQRVRRWWPLGRPSQSIPRRNEPMTGVLKLAAAAAILAVAGWALAGGVGQRSDIVQAPSASPEASLTPVVGPDDAFFSGTLSLNGTSFPGQETTHEENGLYVISGWGWYGQRLTTDDPRMTGTRSEWSNGFSDALDNNTVGIGSSLVTIENEQGSWTCQITGIEVMGVGSTDAGWCAGAGDYEGLKAYVVFDHPQDSGAGSNIPVYGFITSGDGPPMPEAPPAV